MKNVILVFLIVSVSCGYSCKQAKKQSYVPPKFDSAFLAYLPSYYSFGNSLLFQNEEGESLEFTIGTGVNKIEENPDTLGITRSFHGMHSGKSINILWSITKPHIPNKPDNMSFGVIGYGSCQENRLWSSNKNNSNRKFKRTGNRTSLFGMNDDSEYLKRDTFCEMRIFKDSKCDLQLKYEFCIEKNKGLMSLKLNGEEWRFVRYEANG